MEELRDPRLAERARIGEARSLRGCGARPVSSTVGRTGDFAEIFGGFASSCTIPVLVLPEAMDGYGLDFAESGSLNYSEIFGDYDDGTFPLSYEELVSAGQGSEEKNDRSQELTNVGLVETGASVPNGDHITFSKVNHTSSSFNSSSETEQVVNISGSTSQQSLEDEVKNTIWSSVPQSYEPYFENEAVSSTGFVEVESPKGFASDDHILHVYMEQEKEEDKQRGVLNRCFAGATLDHSENDPKTFKYFTPGSNAEIINQLSRSSSYHSASSGDIPFSDYSFLTISDINLHTQPLQVPPPPRPPPKLDMDKEMSKSEELNASNTAFDKDLVSETYKSYHALHVGVPRTRHALKETVKANSPVYLNVEVDASSAAAASAAAMIEAMEQAQASLKSAKELMERKRDSPQSETRWDHLDFGSLNGQNVDFTGRSRHKTKSAQKVVLNQAERVNSVFFEDPRETIQGNESRFNRISDDKVRSHEWKIDKQFYQLVSNEKLMGTREMMGTRVINDEKYNSNEAINLAGQLNAYQFFPENKASNKLKNIFSQSNSEIETEKLNQYSGSEKTLYSGDIEEKNEFVNMVDKEEILDILEASAIPYLQGDNKDEQSAGSVVQVCLTQCDKNEIELKCQESQLCGEGEKNEDDKEPNVDGWNVSDVMDFYCDSKFEEFDGCETVGKKVGLNKEYDEIHGISIGSEFDPLSTCECMTHSREVSNSTLTSEFTVNEKFEAKLSSLKNSNEVKVDTECRTSFSIDKEANLEEMKEEFQTGKLKKTRKETYIMSCSEGKDPELKDIDNTCENEISGNFSDTDKTSDEKNGRKQKHEVRAKLNMPNTSKVKATKLSVQPDLENAKEVLVFQRNEEGKESHGGQRKGEEHFVGNVQTALELGKNLTGSSACPKDFQRNRDQDYEAVQQANSLDKNAKILSQSVHASGSSLKHMDKNIRVEFRDADYTRKEIFDRERREAEQKRMLEEERAREREKDRIAVEKTTGESCDKVFAEARERSEKTDVRHKPIAEYHGITERSSSKATERFEKIANEAKLRAERAAVERATTEARERAIERALAEQASLDARSQPEILVTVSKDKAWKNNAPECMVSPGRKVSEISLKSTSLANDAPVDKSQSADGDGESPLRCKARQERYQRIVERAANALAEKNMRDLVAQREQAERNRLAESLDAEVRRWSSGKEGNLRALLSTLQYILGHDSGWQPIPLTEVITSAAVRKAYRKATLYVHPDKLQQRGASIQHKYICEKVFDLLKDAWNKFNSEGW